MNTCECAGSETFVDDVITTHRLTLSASRPCDFEGEATVLSELADMMTASPSAILQKLSDVVLTLCRAEASGITLLEGGPEGNVLRWVATSGGFDSMAGGTMPIDASPCGTVMTRDQAILMTEPGLAYPAARELQPFIHEIILAPFHVDDRPIGTVWGILHDVQKDFDAEDMRLLRSLAKFAGVAYTVVEALRKSHERAAILHEKNARRLVLARELTHRMKNLMSLVQAITTQSLRGSGSVEQAEAAIAGRLKALSIAQDLLTQADWAKASMQEIVSGTLSLHDSASGRFDVKGDASVVLSDQQGLGLALALHELATNAAKYGALSNATGRVSISWQKTIEGRIEIQWIECGGPLVTPPTRTGFGSRLIEKIIASYFDGDAKLTYPEDGVHFYLIGSSEAL